MFEILVPFECQLKMTLIDDIRKHPPPLLRTFFQQIDHLLEAISNFLESQNDIVPDIRRIFAALYYVSFDIHGLLPNSFKVVMIFQDPYPTSSLACGIATCSLNKIVPPTLMNMFKRIENTYSPTIMWNKKDGDIRGWCTQGILMTNVTLTTIHGKNKAHVDNWEDYTRIFIRYLSDTFPFLVFMSFGADSRKMCNIVNKKKHTVIETSHPSGLGAHHGFNTCNIFNECNQALILNKRDPIKWEQYNYV